MIFIKVSNLFTHLFVLFCALSVFSSRASSCFITESKRIDVSPFLLEAIAMVESSLDSNALNQNRNGTRDIGIMQINSWWIKRLHLDESRLKEPCYSIRVAAQILKHNFDLVGRNWNAIGIYHSGTANDSKTLKRRTWYANRVFSTYSRLLRR